MNAISIDFLALAQAWLAAIVRASGQGAIGVALVWCLCRYVTSLPPSIRCWLWRLVLVKFLLVAFFPQTIDLPWLAPTVAGSATDSPRVSIADIEAEKPSRLTPKKISVVEEKPGAAEQVIPGVVNAPSTRTAADLWNRLPLVLFTTWVFGILAWLAVIIRRIRAAQRWRKQCVLVKDADALTVCENLAREFSLYQPPVLMVSDVCETPVVFGWLRTSVVLPTRLVGPADPARLTMILRHELAHIGRHDLLWNWMATVTGGLFFFHPLVWLAMRELRLSQELACDARTVESPETSIADYGALLVELAAYPRTKSNILATVGVVESYDLLKRRLKAMSQFSYKSRWIRPVSVSLLTLTAMAMVPWRLVAEDPPTPAKESVSTAAQSESAAPKQDESIDKMELLSAIREATGRRAEALRTGQTDYKRDVKSWVQMPARRPITGTEFEGMPYDASLRGRFIFDVANLRFDGKLTPDESAKLDPYEVRYLRTSRWFAETKGDDGITKIYDLPGEFSVEDPRQIGKVWVGDIDRLTVMKVLYEGRECYRLEEIIPRAAVRYVQIVFPKMDYVLLRLEKYYDNAHRKGEALREDHPFQIVTIDYQLTDDRNVWLPMKCHEESFESVPLAENRKPTLIEDVKVEIGDYSFQLPSPKKFTLYDFASASQRLRDNRKSGEGKWYDFPPRRNLADPDHRPARVDLPEDLVKEWIEASNAR